MSDIVSYLSVTNPLSLVCLDFPIEVHFSEIWKAGGEKKKVLFSMAESAWALADGKGHWFHQHSLEHHPFLCHKQLRCLVAASLNFWYF